MIDPPARVSLREMTTDDIPRIAEIEREAFPLPWSAESLAGELDRPRVEGSTPESRSDGVPRRVAWVITTAAAEILGFVIAWVLESEAHVARIAVANAARRRGLARSMMERLIEAARAAGASHVALEVREDNEAALALYRSLGFVGYGRRRGYYAEGAERLDAQLLCLAL